MRTLTLRDQPCQALSEAEGTSAPAIQAKHIGVMQAASAALRRAVLGWSSAPDVLHSVCLPLRRCLVLQEPGALLSACLGPGVGTSLHLSSSPMSTAARTPFEGTPTPGSA